MGMGFYDHATNLRIKRIGCVMKAVSARRKNLKIIFW